MMIETTDESRETREGSRLYSSNNGGFSAAIKGCNRERRAAMSLRGSQHPVATNRASSLESPPTTKKGQTQNLQQFNFRMEAHMMLDDIAKVTDEQVAMYRRLFELVQNKE